jgi:hypothetical protein
LRSYSVRILTVIIDDRDSLNNHSRVKAAANDSDDFLNSLFKNLTNLDKDFIDINLSLNPNSNKRVLETKVKNIDRLRIR